MGPLSGQATLVIFIFVSFFNKDYLLTLLHPERPKLCAILAFLSAIGLKEPFLYEWTLFLKNFVSQGGNRKS